MPLLVGIQMLQDAGATARRPGAGRRYPGSIRSANHLGLTLELAPAPAQNAHRDQLVRERTAHAQFEAVVLGPTDTFRIEFGDQNGFVAIEPTGASHQLVRRQGYGSTQASGENTPVER